MALKLRMGMIRMDPVSYKKVYTILSGVFLMLPFVVQAQQPVTKIILDEATKASGYTLIRGRLDVGIQPTSLTSATKAWVRRVKNYPELPETLKALSPVYSFTIQGETNWLEIPLQFRYHLKGKKYKYGRALYYYDSTSSAWQKLDSSVQRFDRTVSADWGALHAQIIVAADTTDPFGPSKTKQFSDFGDVSAASAIVIDEAIGDVLYSSHADNERSIASMTKLMTAYVLFEQEIDLTAVATYDDSYDQIGGTLSVFDGETMLMEDLMYAMVVGSANNAAYALVGNADYSLDEFIALMNTTATDLGLEDTTFADPSGLAVGNISTAKEYAKLMRVVLQNETLAEISATPYYEFITINYGNYHDFYNTNSLLRTSTLDITASKTGYIDEALYCLAMRVEQDDHAVIVVVMGAPTSSDRFNESARLANWVFENYEW